MAKAQNSLGQLFIDLGLNGDNKFIRGLNGIQAQFLLTKTAATQMIKPLIEINKRLGESAIGFDKLNAVTGVSAKQWYELNQWAKLNNVDFGLLSGTLQKLQQQVLDIQMGKGNARGFALLGIDPRQLDYSKPLDALNLIRERVQQLDEATAAYGLRELGLSEELLYAFKQNNGAIAANLKLTDKELKNLSDREKAWRKLQVTATAAQDKIIAKQKWINEALKGATYVIEALTSGDEQKRAQLYKAAGTATKQTGEKIQKYTNPVTYIKAAPKVTQKIKHEIDLATGKKSPVTSAKQSSKRPTPAKTNINNNTRNYNYYQTAKQKTPSYNYDTPFSKQMKPIIIQDDVMPNIKDMQLPQNLLNSNKVYNDNRNIKNNISINNKNPQQTAKEVKLALNDSLKFGNIAGV